MRWRDGGRERERERERERGREDSSNNSLSCVGDIRNFSSFFRFSNFKNEAKYSFTHGYFVYFRTNIPISTVRA